MNITICKEEHPSHLTGGEYAISHLEIHLDPDLPLDEQMSLVIHSIIENYCGGWPHNKVDDLTENIMDGLGQLGVKE